MSEQSLPLQSQRRNHFEKKPDFQTFEHRHQYFLLEDLIELLFLKLKYPEINLDKANYFLKNLVY